MTPPMQTSLHTTLPRADLLAASSRGARSNDRSLRNDPTGLHRHHAHCTAARNQLHGLQSAVEAVDAFLSPRFFSMLTVVAAGALLAFWLTT